ncbi:S41 family peptidase [Hymenobacter jeollabukensis]|uniref:Peptidase n=1 Tax=Hymenobacter jeollabukensis TaxID=2025313 RepID=A0A5R8WTC2_9BACT|nr:S41 family peptidase [Hymenobacter jeollabukensis]TLM94109.1 peptidase [Hymenobacter jeollabukensis]
MNKLKHLLAAALLLALPRPAPAQAGPPPLAPAQYREDVAFFWQTVHDDYAYFDRKQTDWERVRARYLPQADTLRSRRALVRLLETMLAELYDHHAALGTNRPDSPRLVPSGSDVYAEWDGTRAVVRDVRPGFGAALVGVRPGTEIVAVDGVPVAEAVAAYLPACLKTADPAARTYALNVLLAGRHDAERRWQLRQGTSRSDVRPDHPRPLLENSSHPRRLESRRYGRTGYIRLHNSLGDNGLITAFDSALDSLLDTRALVLDLRDTPSGGTTTVARAILSRFVGREQYYQQHELVAEERAYGVKRKWAELVSPRGRRYAGRVVVLAGRWTGSMGEGLAIGFDALPQVTVVGTELAGLNGAIYFYRLPNSGIGFSLPTEKLYHVDGTPREDYRPKVLVPPAAPPTDAALDKALRLLK